MITHGDEQIQVWEDVSAIRVSLQLGGGMWFLWEDTVCLSG
jgi:hypothetical protein